MSTEEEKAARGDLMDRYSEAKRHFTTLQAEAEKLAGQLIETANLLLKGPPYSVIPPTGFADGLRLQELFKDLHDTHEEKASAEKKLKEFGIL